jgi:glutathione transport system substrate-binding protein
MPKRLLFAGLLTALSATTALAQPAPPHTLVVMRTLDADNYDPVRTTALAAGEVINMMADTLVTMDWDMKTIRPGLAKSWSVSPDGLTYTFKLRDDVSFCDGRKMTADDVAYSLTRLAKGTPKSPAWWRAGPLKEARVVDPTTVEYVLNTPYSELLYQLSMYFNSVVDKNAVEKLGANFGVQGFNGTGPFCWSSWTPRNEMVLTKHEGYNWGPPIFKNPSPQVDKVIWRIIPDPNTRLAALQSGQGDVVYQIPYYAIDGLKKTPGIHMSQQPNYLFDYFMGFKVDKPFVNDPQARRAMVMAVNRPAIAKAVFFGAADSADALLNPQVLDYDPKSKELMPAFDPDGARKLLDEAGWKPGSDGIRVKDGVRAGFVFYGLSDPQTNRAYEAIQADLRRVGVDMQIQFWDATVGWGKLATQEFGAFGMSYPYVSAGDALSLYFQSQSTPTPNRMNWKNPQTDQWLADARAATSPDVAKDALAKVQEQLTQADVWIPMVHTQMWVASSARTQGARAYGLYGIGLFKGLDVSLTR